MEKEIRDINTDLCEIESLLNIASRQRIKNFLNIELRKLISEKQKLEQTYRNKKSTKSKILLNKNDRNFQVKIDSYAWDQSPKYIKIFLTLPKVHQVDSDNVKCQFGTDSMTFIVKNLEQKDFVFNIARLLHPVVPEKSFWRVESDTVVIFLVKSSTLKWRFLTKTDEEKALEKNKKYTTKKTDEHNENSLFSLMKNMYETGDDELKRTIAQAWTEGQ